MNELDFIKTVKIQGQGYLLNNTMSVPKADGNREYELIKKWLSEGNTPEPEFTEEEIKVSTLNKQIQEAKTYLSETSWIWEKYSRNVLALKDLTVEEFNTKYGDIILAQEEARLNINKYEQELLALETKGAN